jgi:tRNA threonylcarbamoyladenosine biosynthesis protein TsaE
MTELTIGPGDESLTVRLGSALATLLPPTATIALIGPLGAGKTRLVQAVAEAAGVGAGIVASPTFVLVHEYAARSPIFHFDVYRLRDEDEFLALGPEEYFAREGWTFVEWADRMATCLPTERLEIEIVPLNATTRRFELRAIGDEYVTVLPTIASAMT